MTTDTLAFTQRPIRVDIDDVSLRPGHASHELRIPLKLHAAWLPTEPADAGAVLAINATIDVEAANRQGPLGNANGTYTVRHYSTTETLTMLLTDEQVVALEPAANQDGLRLQIDLTATLFDGPVAPVTTTTQMRHHVTRTRWMELLDQAGAAVAITVRVPSPLSGPPDKDYGQAIQGPSRSQATRRLRQARRALSDGDYERCVQACRAVLEHVKALQQPVPAKALDPARSRRDPNQRWSALFNDAYSLCSAATHEDDNAQTFHWTRADAQAVLALTAALLARIACN